MSGLQWMVALAASAQADCPDVPALVQSAEQAVVEDRLYEAANTLKQAETAFSCSPVPQPQILARYWLAQGALSGKNGDEKMAALCFSAAYRVAPEVWFQSYGADLRLLYETTSQTWLGEGEIRIEPPPEGLSSSLDTLDSSFPTKAAEGLHLVQLGASRDSTAYAEFFYLPPEETYLMLSGLDPAVTMAQAQTAESLSPVETAPAPVVQGRQRSPAFAIAGGVAGAAALGAASLAWAQNPKMRDLPEVPESLVELDAAHQRQVISAAVCGSLSGLSLIGFGLYFAL